MEECTGVKKEVRTIAVRTRGKMMEHGKTASAPMRAMKSPEMQKGFSIAYNLEQNLLQPNYKKVFINLIILKRRLGNSRF